MPTIRLRRGNAATWTSVNPILALGEVGLEMDTHKFKVGDGATSWSALDYWVNGEGGASTGADGDSAYEIAVANGFVGSESEWLTSLHGPAGADGTPGADGDSAYEIAVAAGFMGTETEWLDSLRGEAGPAGADGQSIQGDPGPQGQQGIQGPPGPAGAGVSLLGTALWADIELDEVAGDGDMYILLADDNNAPWSGPDGLVPARAGDGILKTVDGWINVGPIRGPQGEQGPAGVGLQGPAGPAGAVGPAGADSTVPGPQGETGPEGPQGIQGPAGPAGASLTILGTVANDSLPASPSENDLYILSDDGAYGNAGEGVAYLSGAWINVGPIRGPQGEQGPRGPQGVQGDTGPAGVLDVRISDDAPANPVQGTVWIRPPEVPTVTLSIDIRSNGNAFEVWVLPIVQSGGAEYDRTISIAAWNFTGLPAELEPRLVLNSWDGTETTINVYVSFPNKYPNHPSQITASETISA